MKHISSILNKGETILKAESFSKTSLKVFGVVCLLWSMIGLFFSFNSFIFFLMFFGFIYSAYFIATIGCEFVVTNQRVLIKTGLIGVDVKEIPLHKVETIEYKQGIIGRIFNYGSVRVTGTGISGVGMVLDNPKSFRQMISNQIG
jgi:uncharacterized membrane protein YdbT with pleckstrin-like domain